MRQTGEHTEATQGYRKEKDMAEVKSADESRKERMEKRAERVELQYELNCLCWKRFNLEQRREKYPEQVKRSDIAWTDQQIAEKGALIQELGGMVHVH